jgi:hypothetical protein
MTYAQGTGFSTDQPAPQSGSPWTGPDRGPGYGMMGGGPGYGMMGDFGRGEGFRPGYGPDQSARRIAASRIETIINGYLATLPDNDLKVAEIMQFQDNYYAQISRKGTNDRLFEVLVNPFNGVVSPEPGPNMMWNTLYGHGDWSRSGTRTQTVQKMTVTADQASKIATGYVERISQSARVGTPDTFPGYYTLHVIDNGKTVGMLSVNGYTGQVWYHNWHGTFIGMVKTD